ncbi:MAG: precorrin-4 C(11)-methyltransferase [Lachnospiraceae bacterium]|nr:precorrin-4 C(11)-methyltransferase [Lachnospiraceae bacterium]
MVHFVGAGPGAVDLITVRGQRLLAQADVIIYAGSLVNPALLRDGKKEARIYNSAKMTLEEVIQVMRIAWEEGKETVRLHTGDPSLYGAIREQMDLLDKERIPYDVTPGVSSFCGAASALHLEYTLPGLSQSVVITRMEGRTKVPPKEEIRSFAAHRATMVLFLSAGLLERLEEELVQGGYPKDTPAALVYKATWEDEKTVLCTVGTLVKAAGDAGIHKTALIIVGDVVAFCKKEEREQGPESALACREEASPACREDASLACREDFREDASPAFREEASLAKQEISRELQSLSYERSKLYDPSFTTEFRRSRE